MLSLYSRMIMGVLSIFFVPVLGSNHDLGITKPEGVHLSLGPQISGQTSEMFVDWSNIANKKAHTSDWKNLAQTRVEYGLSEANLNLTKVGTTIDLYAGGNTTRFLSSAHMDRLEPGRG